MNKHFPNKFYINLDKRVDRDEYIQKEFNKYGIDADRFEADECEDGRIGIIKTTGKLLLMAKLMGYTEVGVFEDDCQFLSNPNKVVNNIVASLPNDFDILYFGGTLMTDVKPYKENLSQIVRCYGLWAVCYSENVYDEIIHHCKKTNEIKSEKDILDVWIADNIQPRGKCFIVRPLLCTQRADYSDIEKRKVNYQITTMLYDKFDHDCF